MEVLKKKFFSDNINAIQAEALNECLDLIANGYRVISAAYFGRTMIFVLRHCRNTRKLLLSICPEEYTLSEQGRVLKSRSDKA